MNPAELPLPSPTRAPAPAARRPLRSLASLAGLMVLAWLALRFSLPLPPCPLRAATDVPCPFCGSTRAFAALAQVDFTAALRLNPLVSLAALGAGGIWLLALGRGDAWRKQVVAGVSARAGWKWLLALAVAANWFYLWLRLPR